MATLESIDKIVDEIFRLDSPPVDSSRRQAVVEFIKTTINGDSVSKHLAINALLSKDKEGVIVCVLTDFRLVKIDIDAAGKEMKSADFFLRKTDMEWTLSEGDRSGIRLSSSHNAFSLTYSDPGVTEFFKEVDQARIKDQGRVKPEVSDG